MTENKETYEQEMKRFQRLLLITISLVLVSIALIIVGYFLHNTNIFVFFIVFITLSCLFLVILGAERYEMSNRFKLIHK